MHRNTYLFIACLAVFAALVIGVNLGRGLSPATPITQSAVSPTPVASPTPVWLTYVSSVCGVTLMYPDNMVKLDNASNSAILNHPDNPQASVVVTCQPDIPRPPLLPEKIETIQLGSVSAKLYHDASAKDGTPVDKLIFRHPQNGMDVFVAGIGSTFQQIVSSLKIL